MFSNHLHFIHYFDEKMHYSLYYSLLELKDNDKISFNDSVQQKTCALRPGRWNFTVGNKDYSCGVYHLLEVIRQSIIFAKENNKTSVNIALVPTKANEDICYTFNCEKTLLAEHHQNCESGSTKVSKHLFFKVIKPVLEEMFKKHYKITTKQLKNKQDIDIIHIEWRVDNFFNNLFLKQTNNKMEVLT